jgi:hypothetical protein
MHCSPRNISVPHPHVISAVAIIGGGGKNKPGLDDNASNLSIDACRMRMLAHSFACMSMEASPANSQRSAAVAVAAAAVNFMRARSEKKEDAQGGGSTADDAVRGGAVSVEGELRASAVAHMTSHQLLLLFEEMLAMLVREQRTDWQQAVVAAAQALCGHITSAHDATCVLLLLCYPPPSVDSFAMLDACFLRLLRICPQVPPRQFSLSLLPFPAI